MLNSVILGILIKEVFAEYGVTSRIFIWKIKYILLIKHCLHFYVINVDLCHILELNNSTQGTTVMLSEQQCRLIENELTRDVEPRKVAAYLCLHMGLMLMEVTALQWGEIDLDTEVMTLSNVVNAAGARIPLNEQRTLPIPTHIIRYLNQHSDLYESDNCYILTGKETLPSSTQCKMF